MDPLSIDVLRGGDDFSLPSDRGIPSRPVQLEYPLMRASISKQADPPPSAAGTQLEERPLGPGGGRVGVLSRLQGLATGTATLNLPLSKWSADVVPKSTCCGR